MIHNVLNNNTHWGFFLRTAPKCVITWFHNDYRKIVSARKQNNRPLKQNSEDRLVSRQCMKRIQRSHSTTKFLYAPHLFVFIGLITIEHIYQWNVCLFDSLSWTVIELKSLVTIFRFESIHSIASRWRYMPCGERPRNSSSGKYLMQFRKKKQKLCLDLSRLVHDLFIYISFHIPQMCNLIPYRLFTGEPLLKHIKYNIVK